MSVNCEHIHTIPPLEMASDKIRQISYDEGLFIFGFREFQIAVIFKIFPKAHTLKVDVLPKLGTVIKNMYYQNCTEARLLGKARDIPVSSNSNNNEGSTVP